MSGKDVHRRDRCNVPIPDKKRDEGGEEIKEEGDVITGTQGLMVVMYPFVDGESEGTNSVGSRRARGAHIGRASEGYA